MPGMSQQEAEMRLEEQASNAAMERQGALSGSIPPADEPLDPDVVNTLGQMISMAAERLSGGQVKQKLPPVDGPVDALPPELFAPLAAIAAFVQQQPAGESYAFDPVAMSTTNDGIAQMGAMLDELSQDQALIEAAAAPAEMPPENMGGEEELTEEDELDELV